MTPGGAARAAVAELFRAYHHEERAISDAQLDAALGLDERATVRTSYDPELEAAHAGESVVYLPTPYPVCRTFFSRICAGPQDTIVDLGCGIGRFLAYGALITEARLRGVELVAQRSVIARRCVERLGLVKQVEVIAGNVLDQDLSDASIFYLHRPFSSETEAAVIRALHDLARRQAITVGAYRLLPTLFHRAVFEETHLGDLRIYRSRRR